MRNRVQILASARQTVGPAYAISSSLGVVVAESGLLILNWLLALLGARFVPVIA